MDMLSTATIKSKDGSVVPFGSLQGKIIGLYFSASWCPPCRAFTPKLSAKYDELIAAGEKIEIIFISGDQNEKAANEYFSHMSFKMLSYDDREVEQALSEKFEVSGIPTLVLLDENGELLSSDGRTALFLEGGLSKIKEFEADKKAAEEEKKIKMNNLKKSFSWENIFEGKSLQRNDGATIEISALEGKIVGLYFSAHWCGPCRAYTPKLVEKYSSLIAEGKPFEIIFVSFDRNEDQYKEYFSGMPWLSLDFSRRETAQLLAELFDVSGIPALTLFDENAKKLTDDGTEDIMKIPFEELKALSTK